MATHNRKVDITVEIVVEKYKKCPNLIIVAEKLGCSKDLVKRRLKEAGVKVVQNNQHTRRKLNENKIK